MIGLPSIHVIQQWGGGCSNDLLLLKSQQGEQKKTRDSGGGVHVPPKDVGGIFRKRSASQSLEIYSEIFW